MTAVANMPPPRDVAAVFVFVAFCFALAHAMGCQTPKVPVTEAEKQVAAEGTYGGELQKCVAENDTAADIDACADDVRRRWSTKDGGAR